MKSLMFGKAFGHHVLSVFLLVSTTFALGNLAAAADANDPPSKGVLHQESVNVANEPSRAWESKLRLDKVQFVEAQVFVGNTCYTPAGSCSIFNGPLPVGSPCWCGSPYYGPSGRVGLP